MATKDKRIDAYIAKSADFAKPILNHLRKLVHTSCPDVEETMKWSFPHFDYKGEMMCSMAAFKQHCVFGFWKASLMKDPSLLENAKAETAMGHMGRITLIKDLPSDKKMMAYIKEAMKLNEEGKKVVKAKPSVKKDVVVPDYFTAAVKKNKKASATFEAFSPSSKREYVEWVDEAKTDETRNKRLNQSIEWMAEGKKRNWKYER
ncbi:MAG: YdeI/OmpD-associated family protein [Sphingobacteriales bacterium]